MLWTGKTAEAEATLVPVASFEPGSVAVAVIRGWEEMSFDPGGDGSG
jgi:hypothetical protein